MNRKAKELHLTKTVFANPHGLSNILNVSSAKDMIFLSLYSFDNPTFREIVNCEQYASTFYGTNMQKADSVKTWVNTNKLLSLGWEGIKTGQTSSAGCCLASVREGIFVVVLNSVSRDARFDDSIMLWEWYYDSSPIMKE